MISNAHPLSDLKLELMVGIGMRQGDASKCPNLHDMDLHGILNVKASERGSN
jgi:hypothetical protein